MDKLFHHRHIHKIIRKHAPHAARKARRLFSFRYPKLFIFLLFILGSYYIFSKPEISSLVEGLNSLSYVGIFIVGMLFSFGFSAPISVGFLLVSAPSNIFLASLIGGVGSAFGDLIIFKIIKFSFMNEFEKLKKLKIIKKIEKMTRSNKHLLIRHYLLYVFAGIVLASPLPDELGISMLAGLTTIKLSKFMLISFVLHTIAILFILYLGVVL